MSKLHVHCGLKQRQMTGSVVSASGKYPRDFLTKNYSHKHRPKREMEHGVQYFGVSIRRFAYLRLQLTVLQAAWASFNIRALDLRSSVSPSFINSIVW